MTKPLFSHRLSAQGLGAGALALFAAALVAGCSKAEPPKAPPPPLVDVVTLSAQPVTLTSSLPGRTVPFRIAQVRPQVSGVIVSRDYDEGSLVKKGEQLYQIDPAPYQAAFDSAKAALLKAQAALSLSSLTVKRYGPLVESNAVSKLTFETAQATEQSDRAQVAAAKAALETARINLGYTKVVSPIKGQSSRSLVTEGALVTADQSGTLTTIQQLDPIYVDATQPADTLLRLQREYAAGELKHSGDNQARVELTLSDGTKYPVAGKLQFADTTVDQSTGSVTLRAVFPNPKHVLLPGMFVHLQIDEGTREQALLAPQQGVTHDASGAATAMIVNDKDEVQQVKINADRAIGSKWLVTSGLKAGDRVIIGGLQFIKPGEKVRVQEARLQPPSQPASAGSALAAAN